MISGERVTNPRFEFDWKFESEFQVGATTKFEIDREPSCPS